MYNEISAWILFNLFVLVALVVDLGLFQRKLHIMSYREALIRSGLWISLALIFCVGLYFFRGGAESSLNFLTGYLIELSLSVDNLFVFLAIFSYFAVNKLYVHRVLFWGILGAIIFRAIFIFAGILLLEKFHWLIYVLGILILIAGLKLALGKDETIHPEHNPILKLLRKLMPVTDDYQGEKFFIKKERKYWATPLFVVLLVVETSDILFAVDSVPAILAITTDPFIVYTSNVFAILGLRSMYFALEKLLPAFHYINLGLAMILIFIGFKMLLSIYIAIPILITLGVVITILAISIAASLLFPKKL